MTISMHDLLERIRNQKGFLIGRRSAEGLHAFLSGFAYARREIEGAADYQFLSEFTDWVQKHCNVKSTVSWAKIIEFYSNEESQELPLFWSLYDQYREKCKRGGRRSRQRKEAS
jgi:hypothetical protein